MVKILKYNNTMQNEAKDFILKNMKTELRNVDNKAFEKITADLNNIEDNYIKTNGAFLVAYETEKKKIIGTIALKYENNVAMLKRFYVDSEYRNQKIGSSLYSELEKIIVSKNIVEIYLVSGEELTIARNFYTTRGWKIENNNPGIYVREGAYLYKNTKIRVSKFVPH